MRKIAWVALLGVVALLFSLRVASASDPITGKWTFLFDTGDGEKEVTADLKLDGDKVGGKFAGKADVKGTFKDQKIDLAFPFDYEEGNISDVLKITGKLEKGALAGDWTFSQYSGTYTARRESGNAPEKKPAVQTVLALP